MKPHDWVTIAVHENEAGSRDTYSQCARCRLVRHDYAYPMSGDRSDMRASPNYPMFHPSHVTRSEIDSCSRGDMTEDQAAEDALRKEKA